MATEYNDHNYVDESSKNDVEMDDHGLILSDSKTNVKHDCPECGKLYVNSSSLYKHLRNIHKCEPHFPTAEISCSLCGVKFRIKINYEKHLLEQHQVSLVTSEQKLGNWDTFIKWKKEIEKTTVAQFVKKSGSRKINNETISYYYCHRSGVFSSKGQKRRLKGDGSNLIGATCPATMKVIENSDGVSIRFVETHVGHKNELSKMPIPDEEKQKICQQLRNNVPISRILKNVRASATAEQERVHLIKRKDILNIKRQFNIDQIEVFDCTNDAEGISESIDSFGEDDESSIIFIKQQGFTDPSVPELFENDFMLVIMNPWQKKMLNMFGNDTVCIDFIRGLSAFNLVTLAVVDDEGEGCPGAFIFSNRHDNSALSIALEKLKNSGVNIMPKTFMSDDDSAFYDSWRGIFGDVENRLLCVKQMGSYCQRNLNERCNKNHQLWVYNQLHYLLSETDENAFTNIFSSFIQLLATEQSSIADFGKYFKEHYSKQPEVQASCHKLNTASDKSMEIDDMKKDIHSVCQDVMKSVSECTSQSKIKVVHKMMQKIKDVLEGENDRQKNLSDTIVSNKKIGRQKHSFIKKKAIKLELSPNELSIDEELNNAYSFLLS